MQKRGLSKSRKALKKMKKKSLSAVITSLIMILLVLVAIGVVWVVVKNTVYDETEQVSLSPLTVDIEVEGIRDNGDTIDVRVKRNVGKGEIEGLKFIVSDGVNSEIFEEPANLKELGEKTFTLNYEGLVKEVSVAPIIKTESGKASAGNIADTLKLSNKEILKNLGAVSWWRFNGNANDEIGGNHGTLGGGVDCSAEGKYGRACSFDGINDYFIAPSNLRIEDNITVVLWIKTSDAEGDIIRSSLSSYVGKKSSIDLVQYLLYLSEGVIYGDSFSERLSHRHRGLRDANNTPVNDNEWHQIAFVRNSSRTEEIGAEDYRKFIALSRMFLYKEGEESDKNHARIMASKKIIPGSRLITAGGYFGDGGISRGYKGMIDEVIVFNKSLNPQEIKSLYYLNLE